MTTQQSLPVLKLEDLKASDRKWIVINGQAIDVTDFLQTGHPGGNDLIEDVLGKDATTAFNGAGHSEGAKRIMRGYAIGILSMKDEASLEQAS